MLKYKKINSCICSILFLFLSSKNQNLKLFRYILPIFFFLLSLGAVGQKDCKCFWVVLDEGIEMLSLGANVDEFHYGRKTFYRIEPVIPSCSLGVQPIVILLDSIGGNSKSSGPIFINWHGSNNSTELLYLTQDYYSYNCYFHTHINTCLYDGIIEIPWSTIPYLYDSSGRNYFIDVDLQPCESFESFLKKYKKGLYMPYQQPYLPEKTNKYEADGFKSLKEW